MIHRRLEIMRADWPNLPRDALVFFDFAKIKPDINGDTKIKTVGEFSHEIAIPNSDASRIGPDPVLIDVILTKLVHAGLLRQVGPVQGNFGHETMFITTLTGYQLEGAKNVVNFVAYGLPAIVAAYAASTFQILAMTDGKIESGTSFVTGAGGLATARHCVEKAPELAIVGLSATDCCGARIFLSRSELVDCAMILFPSSPFNNLQSAMWDETSLLDEVVIMGYPSIPTLRDVRVSEKATVSTIIRGTIGGTANDIFNTDLLLITSRARGGFSGGPVINVTGGVVGMITRKPSHQDNPSEGHRYDDEGYCLAIPSETIERFIKALGADETLFEERHPSTFKWVDG